MVKWFNVKGLCIPSKHYMVDITDRLKKMKRLVDREEYFVINRGRQYGKTTTLSQLRSFICTEYIVIFLNFQGFGTASFTNEKNFCQKFFKELQKSLQISKNDQLEEMNSLNDLDDYITKICKDQKVVLMIDEVDRASNYRVFLDFLGILRTKFQARTDGFDFTFHSVILAGVYDIKNLKMKMIKEGVYVPTNEERGNESPWNIAENFAEEMAFSASEIAGMLDCYEADHHTFMDTSDIAEEIYSFTSGYPFLVSRICQYIDEKLDKNWSRAGVKEAVRLITEEPQPNTLFDDLFKNIRNNEELARFLREILLEGEIYQFSQGVEVIEQGLRYAFIRIMDRTVVIHNKIFAIIITSYFITKEKLEAKKLVKNSIMADVVSGDQLNIELFFEKFRAHYKREYGDRDERFLEREATFLFLFFLQPYLNGKGFYYFESKPNHATGKRMDVVVTYGITEFIIELKVWKGPSQQEKAYNQLTDYMTHRGADKGYLLTFDFRKTKEEKQEWLQIDGVDILEVQV